MIMHTRFWILLTLSLATATPALAQLGLPPLGPIVEEGVRTVGGALDGVDGSVDSLAGRATSLARQRTKRLAAILRRHPEAIEPDAAGALARKGELLVIAASEADLARARAAGFVPIGTEQLGELGLEVARLMIPAGTPLRKAEVVLQELLPHATITADTLHFQAGWTGQGGAPRAPMPSAGSDIPIGVIDGAPGRAAGVSATKGFARGAPLASNHGSAVVSLMKVAGAQRIMVADVYGNDPAGGNALAISRGLNWLLGQGARVISISLVGPANPVVERAIAVTRQRGVVVVAAVGNDGPAAPPAYPASYPGVIAVTGVDSRNRALIEAGRALHLDYAAPGADMTAANAAGRWVRIRGTSYAVPLVAARAAAVLNRAGTVTAALDDEAMDLGDKGADRVYGRGLLCGACRRRP